MASCLSEHRTHAHAYASSSLEYRIIYHCSPTLASLKPGSLFRCAHHTPQTPCATHIVCKLKECCAKLAPFGVEMQILSQSPKGSLIYVFRPALLERELRHPQVTAHLNQLGYPTDSVTGCINHLRNRIAQMQGFPHEIGFFLGYPIHDVFGFIEHQGKNHLFAGYWKVYQHPQRARKLFRSYRAQTLSYLRRYQAGTPIEQLICEAVS